MKVDSVSLAACCKKESKYKQYSAAISRAGRRMQQPLNI